MEGMKLTITTNQTKSSFDKVDIQIIYENQENKKIIKKKKIGSHDKIGTKIKSGKKERKNENKGDG